MFLISGRFRRWLLLFIAVPLGAWLLSLIADWISASRGESHVTRALRAPQNWRQRRKAAA